MAKNKTYEVVRVELDSRLLETVYYGRIRDCKNSINRIEENYKDRGFITLNTGFTLIIYSLDGSKAAWTYVIKEKK